MVRLAASCDLAIWRTCTLYDTLLFNNDWSRVFSLAKSDNVSRILLLSCGNVAYYVLLAVQSV